MTEAIGVKEDAVMEGMTSDRETPSRVIEIEVMAGILIEETARERIPAKDVRNRDLQSHDRSDLLMSLVVTSALIENLDAKSEPSENREGKSTLIRDRSMTRILQSLRTRNLS